MSRAGLTAARARRAALTLLAAAIVAAGLTGAYGYGQAYSLHRGFAPIQRLPGAGVARVFPVTFYSAALHRRADYLVALPPGYSAARRYPVMYLLHGAPGSPDAFTSILELQVRLANLVSRHRAVPMILAMLDGRIGGAFHSDSQWANTAAGAYESYVLDAVADVDHRFATQPTRSARVIAGYSAGAYAAMNIGLHHLATFGAVQSWSGYYLQTPTGVFAHAGAAALARNSPLDYAAGLGGTIAHDPLRAFMYVGRLDSDRLQTPRMNRALARAGAHSSYRIFPGGHDWQLWTAHATAMVALAAAWVSHPLPAGHLVRAHRGHRAGAALTPRSRPRTTTVTPAHARPPAPRATGPGLAALLGLVLALGSAALINLGFLLQHRGVRGPESSGWAAAMTNPTWLAGQALGWSGFAIQFVAVGLAPLSLVQAFAAGGLAISVPLASRLFSTRVSRPQAVAVLTMAAALATLPLGLGRVTSSLHPGTMGLACVLALGTGAAVALAGSAASRALGAGLFYGAADAAVKALALGLHRHGVGALVSVWTAVLAGGTLAGFIAFQSALRLGSAITAISLMTALTTLTAMAFGVVAFGESLGTGAGAILVHLIAVGAVLACVPVLAGARREVPGETPGGGRAVRIVRATATGAWAALWLALAVVAGTGLVWSARGVPVLAAGPRLADALSLMQLAGQDAQPLAALAAGWLAAGLSLRLALGHMRPGARAAGAVTGALVLLWLASDLATSVARNLSTIGVIDARVPGAAVFAAAALFGLGAWAPSLPRPARVRLRPRRAPLLLVRAR